MEIQTLMAMVFSKELNPRMEVEEGLGSSGFVSWVAPFPQRGR